MLIRCPFNDRMSHAFRVTDAIWIGRCHIMVVGSKFAGGLQDANVQWEGGAMACYSENLWESAEFD